MRLLRCGAVLLALTACGPKTYALRPLPAALPTECQLPASAPSSWPSATELVGEYRFQVTRTHIGDSATLRTATGRLWFLPWASFPDRQGSPLIRDYPVLGFHTVNLGSLGASVMDIRERLTPGPHGLPVVRQHLDDSLAVAGLSLQAYRDSTGRLLGWLTGSGLDTGVIFRIVDGTRRQLIGTWDSRIWATEPFAQGYFCVWRISDAGA